MKKIAYVLSAFPVHSETFIGNEIRAMEAAGHEIVPMVFDLRKGPAQPQDEPLVARMQRVRAISAGKALSVAPLAWRALPFVRDQKLLSPRSLLWHAMKIAGHAKANRCTHIHAHFAGGAAAHAIAAGRICEIPVSFTCHGHDVYAEPEDLEAKLRTADAVVAVCADLASDIRAMEPRARVFRVACGTDPDRFEPRPEGKGDNGRFLFVGRLVPQKGLDDLFEAIRIATPGERIALDIVGDGPLRDWAEEQATALNAEGHSVRLLGKRDSVWLQKHGPDYLAACLPFKTAPDGSRDTGPLVVKEAMAMGLPVISTAYMGVKETVTPRTGILVRPGDAPALAGALLLMLGKSPQERREMGMAGRERVRAHFTLGEQARALTGVLEAA